MSMGYARYLTLFTLCVTAVEPNAEEEMKDLVKFGINMDICAHWWKRDLTLRYNSDKNMLEVKKKDLLNFEAGTTQELYIYGFRDQKDPAKEYLVGRVELTKDKNEERIYTFNLKHSLWRFCAEYNQGEMKKVPLQNISLHITVVQWNRTITTNHPAGLELVSLPKGNVPNRTLVVSSPLFPQLSHVILEVVYIKFGLRMERSKFFLGMDFNHVGATLINVSNVTSLDPQDGGSIKVTFADSVYLYFNLKNVKPNNKDPNTYTIYQFHKFDDEKTIYGKSVAVHSTNETLTHYIQAEIDVNQAANVLVYLDSDKNALDGGNLEYILLTVE